MRYPIYYDSRKCVLYVFSILFIITILIKIFLAPSVIPRSVPVIHTGYAFSFILIGLIIHTILPGHLYRYTLLIFLSLFSLYSMYEARYILPVFYSSHPPLTGFYLVYFLEFLICLAIGAYIFKPYVSWIFPVMTLAFLLVLQPKVKIITFFLYSFIIFVNLYTFFLFLLLRFVKNQNRNLSEARSKIVEQEKMSSLATFSAGLAHEINNPVNYMYGNLHFLEEYHGELKKKCSELKDMDLQSSIEDMGKILKRYREGFDRIVQIINTMKQAFPVKEGQQRRENISEILYNACTIVQKRSSSKIHFSSSIQPDMYYSCHAAEILTLIINLLSNAVDAVQEISGDKIIEIRASALDESIQIKIRDNGHGVEEKKINKIFEPFFSTKDGKGNIGIGLTLCKSIVHHYNGEIRIDSLPDKYTSVVIILPKSA